MHIVKSQKVTLTDGWMENYLFETDRQRENYRRTDKHRMQKYYRLIILPVKEIFIEHWVIVCKSLSEPGQPGGWDLLERGLNEKQNITSVVKHFISYMDVP